MGLVAQADGKKTPKQIITNGHKTHLKCQENYPGEAPVAMEEN